MMRHSRFIALLAVIGLIVVVIILAILLAQPAGAAGQCHSPNWSGILLTPRRNTRGSGRHLSGCGSALRQQWRT